MECRPAVVHLPTKQETARGRCLAFLGATSPAYAISRLLPAVA
jgi:hypothetical protein